MKICKLVCYFCFRQFVVVAAVAAAAASSPPLFLGDGTLTVRWLCKSHTMMESDLMQFYFFMKNL
jgi:hypothetical protein